MRKSKTVLVPSSVPSCGVEVLLHAFLSVVLNGGKRSNSALIPREGISIDARKEASGVREVIVQQRIELQLIPAAQNES